MLLHLAAQLVRARYTIPTQSLQVATCLQRCLLQHYTINSML
jgi:hypothetical protein